MSSPDTSTETSVTPAYLPWATLISALENLREHGIPGTGKLDKSLWDTQSGAIQGQIVIALRFLGLIDARNRVLPPLPLLVQADAEERKRLLRQIIMDKYKSVVSRDLTTISSGQLEEAIRAFGVSGSTLIRAIRFFVKACQETDIPISKRVSEKVRTAPVARKSRKTNGIKKETSEEDQPPHVPQFSAQVSGWEDRLLEKFPTFDPSWPDEIKTKWFAGFDRLMAAKRGKG